MRYLTDSRLIISSDRIWASTLLSKSLHIHFGIVGDLHEVLLHLRYGHTCVLVISEG
jgi:hypothetical protein